MMLEINLLPWRAYRREARKKHIILFLIGLIGLLIAFFLVIFKLEKKQPADKTFAKSVQSTMLSTPIPKTLPQSFYKFQSHKNHKTIDVAFLNISLKEALNQLARFIHLRVIISPTIQGLISLQLQDISPEKALAFIIASYHLKKWQTDHIWVIGTSDDFKQHQQEEFNFQTMMQEMTPLRTRVWQIHYAKASDIAHILQDNLHTLLSKRGTVIFDSRTNILCVHDLEDNLTDIDHLIKRLDVAVKQVLIEAHLASIDNDYEKALGIDFNEPTSNGDETTPRPPHVDLAMIKLANGSLLHVQLAALEQEGHGELISSPSLFTADQETATIEAGEEIPYQEISRSGGTGVAFKKAVLSLKVTPHVMPGKQVRLQLQVNQDKPSNRVVLGVPAISTRQISTNILVNHGQTIVLGGIYETNHEAEQERIPFLNKIPLVGSLFSQQNETHNKRELLIFVTPKIIG